MVDYKEKMVRNKRRPMLFEKVLEGNTVPHEVKLEKGKIRKRIGREVFDINDSVADNSKLIFLLMDVVARMYEVMPEDSKENIRDREVIEGMIGLYESQDTLAHVRLREQGIGMVETLLKRQDKIASIVKDVCGLE